MGYQSPNRILFRALRIVVLPLTKVLFRFRRAVDPKLKQIDGPLLIVGNHSNFIDPLFLALAVPNRRINFVAGSVLMKKALPRKLMRYMQVIPKLQFVTDTRALRSMLEIIKQDGTLALFPEGRRSMDGASEPFDIATAKLVKKYRLNLATICTNGAYLSWPRWSRGFFHLGPIESTSTLLLERSDVDRYSAEEIQNIMFRALEVHDFNWQERRKHPAKYLTSKPAEGLHRLLHRCPNCDEALVLKSTKKTVSCSGCDYAVRMKRDMMFYPAPATSARHPQSQTLYFPTLYDWYRWQRQKAAEERYVKKDQLSYPARIVEFEYGDDPKTGLSMLVPSGLETKGSLTLLPDKVSFTSDPGSGSKLLLAFPLANESRQVYTNFSYFQLAQNGRIYNIIPEHEQNCIRSVNWIEATPSLAGQLQLL